MNKYVIVLKTAAAEYLGVPRLIINADSKVQAIAIAKGVYKLTDDDIYTAYFTCD